MILKFSQSDNIYLTKLSYSLHDHQIYLTKQSIEHQTTRVTSLAKLPSKYRQHHITTFTRNVIQKVQI